MGVKAGVGCPRCNGSMFPSDPVGKYTVEYSCLNCGYVRNGASYRPSVINRTIHCFAILKLADHDDTCYISGQRIKAGTYYYSCSNGDKTKYWVHPDSIDTYYDRCWARTFKQMEATSKAI